MRKHLIWQLGDRDKKMKDKSVLVFAGPSLDKKTKLKYSQFEYRPPALQGDIANAAELSTHTHFVIIDGFYKSVPSIWHKEIIYALENGKIVLGTASLGAIRAAEMERYGMIGKGKIYQWFKNGDITRDPDVAVGHGSAEEDFQSFTVPIVNIKSTLEASNNHYKESEVENVLQLARSIFFERRTIKTLCKALEASDIIFKENVLEDLKYHYIDQKQKDANETLQWLTTHNITLPKKVESVNWTIYWNTMITNDTYTQSHQSGLDNTKQAALAFQLINDPESYISLRDQAKVIDYRCWLAHLMGIQANKDEIKKLKIKIIQNLRIDESKLTDELRNRGLSARAFDDYIMRVAVSQKVAYSFEYGNMMVKHNSTHYALLMLSQEAESIQNGLNNLVKSLRDGLYNERDDLGQEDTIPEETKRKIEREINSRLDTDKFNNFERLTGLPLMYFRKFAEKYKFYNNHFDQLLRKVFAKDTSNIK